jgi:hypothetical protein
MLACMRDLTVLPLAIWQVLVRLMTTPHFDRLSLACPLEHWAPIATYIYGPVPASMAVHAANAIRISKRHGCRGMLGSRSGAV